MRNYLDVRKNPLVCLRFKLNSFTLSVMHYSKPCHSSNVCVRIVFVKINLIFGTKGYAIFLYLEYSFFFNKSQVDKLLALSLFTYWHSIIKYAKEHQSTAWYRFD